MIFLRAPWQCILQSLRVGRAISTEANTGRRQYRHRRPIRFQRGEHGELPFQPDAGPMTESTTRAAETETAGLALNAFVGGAAAVVTPSLRHPEK